MSGTVRGTIHLIQSDDGPPRCVPLPDDWFMNVAFNYIKFVTYSAVPFVLLLGRPSSSLWTRWIVRLFQTCLLYTSDAADE